MSQAKVDKYKAEKVNRKANVKKAKMMSKIRITVVAVICVLCIGYIGYSAYNAAGSITPSETIAVNLDAVDEYLGSLSE